jgi:hypothetical protein
MKGSAVRIRASASRFAGVFGDCVVGFGNIAEHQPNTVVKGSAAKLFLQASRH